MASLRLFFIRALFFWLSHILEALGNNKNLSVFQRLRSDHWG